MKRSSVIVLFILVSAMSNVVAQESKTALLDTLFSNAYEKKWFNGAVVVGQYGKVIYSKGFGFANFTDSIHFTPSTSSDGGSNAKTLTAAAILLLAEKGALKLSDAVQKYLPTYPYVNTTIRNLITHSTGGLPDYDYFFSKINDSVVLSTQKMIDILNQAKPHLPYLPNRNFYYDSPGFDIAAAIVEQVSGLSYPDFLRAHFFDPLHMKSAFVRPARLTQWPAERTKGYRFQNDSLKAFDISDREGFSGGSNIWFSATDLYHWGTSFYYQTILSPVVLKAIISPVSIQNKPSAIRLGAWYRGKKENAFYYWVNVSGFYSWVYWDSKQEFTIAFVTNTGMPQWIRPQLTSALIDVMEGKQVKEIIEPASAPIEEKQLYQITGFYQINKYGRIYIYLKDGVPMLRLRSKMEYMMVQVGNNIFYVPGLEPWISFLSLKGNKFEELIWSATILHTKGRRIKEK